MSIHEDSPESEKPFSKPVFVGFRSSASLVNIAPAIIEAQKALKNPPKSSRNPHFKNNFAGLDVTLDVVKQAFNSNDLAVLTPPFPAPIGHIGLAVILLHKSGEFIEGRGYMPLEKGTAQGAGSAITYARRYFVQATTGCVGEEDDDGNAASGCVSLPADEFELVARIQALASETKTNVANLLRYYKVETVDALSDEQMKDAIAKLTKKRTMNAAA